jgi:hypothetical protein
VSAVHSLQLKKNRFYILFEKESLIMIRKKSYLLLIMILLIGSLLIAGCSSGKKYYSSKSKEYRKLKKRYEKYDCGCSIVPQTFLNDPLKLCLYPDC